VKPSKRDRVRSIQKKADYEVLKGGLPFRWQETCTRHYDPSGIPKDIRPERWYDEEGRKIPRAPEGWSPRVPIHPNETREPGDKGPFVDPT
jgi:hypothetical protein